MIDDIEISNISNDKNLNNLFLSSTLRDIKEDCKILKSDFFLDSFNYFPITDNYKTFYNLFKRQDDNSVKHFYTKDFFETLQINEKNFKVFDNSFVLGSSPADNYYSNLVYFLPRIFFVNEKKINLIIHRNLSNKFRNLIEAICNMREIEVVFSYIDDNFYRFTNCSVPEFFKIEKSIKILKYFIERILNNIDSPKFGPKIYIRREDASYRKILNESDLIDKLKKKGFEIINPQHFEILVQMKIFSNAKVIISPHGSNLTNIIFSQKGTRVIEIGPSFNNSYEINISNKYKQLSAICDLDYSKISSDSVNVTSHSKTTEKYISRKILNESNYYKNIILKVSEIDKLINNL